MNNWDDRETHIKMPFYDNLSVEDRKKVDAMLDKMKQQRDAGQEVTLPRFKSGDRK